MRASVAIKNFIKSKEGLSLVPYLCSAGVPTIGYGNTVYPNGKKVTMKDKPITKEYAEQMFELTLAQFEKDLKHILGVNILNLGLVTPNQPRVTNQVFAQNRYDALLSLGYNIGMDIDADDIPEGLGDSTLMKMVIENPCNKEIGKQFLRWNKANGKVNNGLVVRRAQESTIYFMTNPFTWNLAA